MEDKTSTRLIDIYTPKQIRESEIILARVKAIIEHNVALDKTDYSSLPEIDVNTYSTEQILAVIKRGSN